MAPTSSAELAPTQRSIPLEAIVVASIQEMSTIILVIPLGVGNLLRQDETKCWLAISSFTVLFFAGSSKLTTDSLPRLELQGLADPDIALGCSEERTEWQV
ncbi:hypothetical protein ACJ73_04557 [Blastomyces percursus]|uniref:Uncharacterized protein n=1 Tax=Blastomyces percursus TaxID=1658174 RepID=A0A1J9R8W5_9EURO|nr:hypothetical protein ACJ73_04557 [Blastomyces percursus]